MCRLAQSVAQDLKALEAEGRLDVGREGGLDRLDNELSVKSGSSPGSLAGVAFEREIFSNTKQI